MMIKWRIKYMERRIRCGVFETNSSSVHSLIVCDEDTFEKWANGELVLDKWNEIFIDPIQELTDDQKNNSKEAYLSEMKAYWKAWDSLTDAEKNEWYKKYAKDNHIIPKDTVTYDEFFNDNYYEVYEKSYTTKNGDDIVCFGQYGYDG